MERVALAGTVAVPWLWVGMVLAISFLEAPLKFRAPGVTLELGLGIGRLVFRALGLVEAGLAAVLVVATAGARPATAAEILVGVLVAVVAAQLGWLRPRLDRRATAVIAGDEVPRSHAHLAYVGLEAVKVVALVALGVLVTSGALR